MDFDLYEGCKEPTVHKVNDKCTLLIYEPESDQYKRMVVIKNHVSDKDICLYVDTLQEIIKLI